MTIHPHCHWRDAQAWRDMGLPMSTTSNEACKLFDAALTQFVGFCSDSSLGNLGECLDKMTKADPDFIVGQVLKIALSGRKIAVDAELVQEIENLQKLAQKPHVKPWEKMHVDAVTKLTEGYTDKACDIWEDILAEYPLDMFALRFVHGLYLETGYSDRMMDSCSRVVPLWKPDNPFYGDVHGMFGFGLEENNCYKEAEKHAMLAIDVNPENAWACHCMAHIREMTGNIEKGIEFMKNTEKYWNKSTLQCHNYWHWGLYYYESGDFEAAMGILDSKILPFLNKRKTVFSLTDAASLLFRLEFEGYNVGSRWNDCFEQAKGHMEDHNWSYYDVNVMLSCMGAQKKEEEDFIIQSVEKFIKDGFGDMKKIYADVTLPALTAIRAYGEGNYGEAVEIMKPVRYQLYKGGGSKAQRDIFNVFIIQAAMKSKLPKHQNFASRLLMERQALKGETNMIDRLTQQLVLDHH